MSEQVVLGAPQVPPHQFNRLTLLLLAATALAIFVCRDGLAWMLNSWLTSEEYSYGLLIPPIAAFLAWQRKEDLRKLEFRGTWSGLALVVFALLLNLLGQLATVFTLQQYAFILMLIGLIATTAGWKVVRELTMPLLVLLFMIPLPNFILNNLSAQLQLVSSQLGVWVIRLFGISVFVEGNVIDLGAMQLQVAEACSGLRYLFPLMTLGFIMAYFFKVALWKRAVVFLSSIPVTILMNSLRIGLIGVTVEHWGRKAAEGFLHDFEGWVVFMASAAVLLFEMLILNRLGGHRRPWREVFGLEFPPPAPSVARWQDYAISKPFIVAASLLLVSGIATANIHQRDEATLIRQTFAEYPMMLGSWSGTRGRLDQEYIDALKFDDYILADYRNGSQSANLYIAWYDTQRAGRATHSPRTCIPGGGWRITSFEQRDLSAISVYGKSLRVNRVLIQSGNQRQLVYYWFQQRDHIVTSEYMVKWHLFWDALTRNRTDGALVRLIVSVPEGRDLQDVETELQGFTREVSTHLEAYVPG